MSRLLTSARAAAWALRACLRRAGFVLAALCLVATAVHGHGITKGELLLDHPYAVPSLAGVNNGAAYLRGIKNRGDKADRLISASSPIAARVELSETGQVVEGVAQKAEIRQPSGYDQFDQAWSNYS